MMDNEIHDTLYTYTDEDGNQGEDLREVQLLESFSQERIEKLTNLTNLTNNEDRYIAYQAMLILLSWGIDVGFKKPHRIYGEDNVYDVISDALYISTYNTNDEDKIVPYIKIMLAMYGNKFFESRLKYVLLKLQNTSVLIPNIKKAIETAIANERYYQASQLLPVIAKYEEEALDQYVKEFSFFTKYDNRISHNLKEIQNYN
ncbi:hypothetical protein [Psychroserpens sp. NJDZ02]|uniref:hypothetical protein n=1 Tax=Psychroserpens sp. NJDZ02 TaxID=2570561 RepID=UPI0010A7ECE7|nr:hypothetical protein [Psychroserpens sp. NJDZ02]QCE42989.1 hypothetical protein E9099_16725 [Psychroserpens sp. NJDZ02]